MESSSALISDVKATDKRWRETGSNSSFRGYGRSKRTFYRNNAKVAKRVANGEGSTGMMPWLRAHTSTDTLASSTSMFEAEATDDEEENNIENDEIDYLEYNDILDETLICTTNEERIQSSSSSSSSSSDTNSRSKRSNKAVVKNKYSRTERLLHYFLKQ